MGYKIELYPEQKVAIDKLRSGCILLADTGAGKTYTSLAFYLHKYSHLDLYVITIPKKRDDGDWIVEANNLGITSITVDSWNNIKKYTDVRNAFFIFDEQRVVGYGTWSKNFIKITTKNKWIMLTATPGDVWLDYIPVFIANKFYKNKTDFVNKHVEWNPWVKFPQVKKYHDTGILMRYRDQITVVMDIPKKTTKHRRFIHTDFDNSIYQTILKNRWNHRLNKPIKNASEGLIEARRCLYSSESRQLYAKLFISVYEKIIVYYNFNYELDILKNICEDLNKEYKQWNGFIHESIPDSGEWVYLVQYTAGAEAWNCITTDTILFYSLNYSYRATKQSEGRIDRINTPFLDLNYYYLYSKNSIDESILKSVKNKKNFNAKAWMKKENL